MRYPPQFIDELRSHFRLSDVIGKRIPVKKHGREYSACCPFHNEKTPSFTINDEKGFYHCFGCGAHGDAINFVKDYHKIPYGEAVERMAQEAGMALPEITPEKRKEMDREGVLQQVMASAAEWFSQQLAAPAARDARDYLQRRGIRPEIIKEFGLGFAPEARQGLHQSMLQRDINPKMQEELGLIVKREDGTLQDKFRDRIQFPIHNLRGAVIAFGGRRMKSDAESKAPKYLNSPDTPLFKKSYVLYNAHRARKSAVESGRLIIAEGYMDVIALAQAGFAGAVAPLGTAITPEQLKLAWGMVDEPILCLDGDSAGERAMLRAAEIALPLLQPAKSLRFCVMPQGEDPDSLILKQGRQAMEEVLVQTTPLVDIIWRKHYEARNPQTPEQKAGAERELMRVVGAIADESVRGYYIREMKERMRQFGQKRDVVHTANSSSQKYNNQYDAGESQGYGKGKAGKKPSNKPVVLPTKLPAMLDANTQTQRCYMQMMALILLVPKLLDMAEVEDALGFMQHEDVLVQALKSALQQSGGADITRDSILSKIASPGLRTQADEITDLMRNPNFFTIAKKKDAEERLQLAFAQFKLLQERVAHVSLQQDYRGVTQQLSNENSEEALKRFYEVTKQVRKRHDDAGWYGEEPS